MTGKRERFPWAAFSWWIAGCVVIGWTLNLTDWRTIAVIFGLGFALMGRRTFDDW